MFPVVREAVARIIDPATIRWIGFSHFESDECGSLNEWLQVARLHNRFVRSWRHSSNVSDFASRAPRWILGRGRSRHREVSVPPLCHPSPAALLGMRGSSLRRRTERCFASDLFLHGGDVEPLVGYRPGGACPKGDDRFSIHAIAERHTLQFHHRATDGQACRSPAEDSCDHAWLLVCGRRGNAIPYPASAMKEVLGKE